MHEVVFRAMLSCALATTVEQEVEMKKKKR
jgi:hypothetical protein